MNDIEQTQLLNALSKGTVTVTFQKVNQDEIRVMPCTLNEKVLTANGQKITPASEEVIHHTAVWSIDSAGWRSFRFDTVVGWEVL